MEPTISLSVSPTFVEGDSGFPFITVLVTLSGPAPAGGTTVHLATQDGTASSAGGSDFQAQSISITFLADATGPATIIIPVKADHIFEPDETFSIHLSNAVRGTIVNGDATVTILNDEALYSVTSNPTTTEGTSSGTGGEFIFTISRSATFEAENVTYVLGGSATADTDYTGASGTVGFAVGQATAVIHIPVASDAVDEFDESVTLFLVGASGDGVINPAAASATGTIIDDDGGVTIVGTEGKDTISATRTVAGQPVPTSLDDSISGLGGNDKLSGLAGNDAIDGGTGKDKLLGGDGNDRLIGGDGKDKLTGEAGADSFVFNASLKADKVTDFSVLDDTIVLSQSAFSTLGLGVLAEGSFHIGKKAADADDFILYNKGKLLYDADGNGGGKAVVFAKLDKGLALTHLDFEVVA